jgi:SAM-dependent methyltransferase
MKSIKSIIGFETIKGLAKFAEMLSDESFDGIISVYTLWHIPRVNHPDIIQNFHRMLTQDGVLVLNTGVYESEGMSNFFGEPMLWSTNNPEKTLSVVKNLGFEIIYEGVLKLGGERQYWIFARKL